MQNNKLTFDGNAYRIELSSGVVYEGSTTNLIAHFSVDTITICDRATKLHIPIMSSRANILEINGEVKTFEQAQTTIEDALSSAGGASSADKVSYDNTNSGLTATNVQSAIDEVGANLGEISPKVNSLMDRADLVSVQAENVGYSGNVRANNAKDAIDEENSIINDILHKVTIKELMQQYSRITGCYVMCYPSQKLQVLSSYNVAVYSVVALSKIYIKGTLPNATNFGIVAFSTDPTFSTITHGVLKPTQKDIDGVFDIPIGATYCAVTDIIKVYDMSFNEDIIKMRRINLFGDSITQGQEGLSSRIADTTSNNSYAKELQELLGNRFEIVNYGAGGEWFTTILTRLGVFDAICPFDFNLPSDKSKVLISNESNILVDSRNGKSLTTLLRQRYTSLDVAVNGIDCQLTRSGENYYLNRKEVGEFSVDVNAGTALNFKNDCDANDILIIFAGMNGVFEDAQEYADTIEQVITCTTMSKYLILGLYRPGDSTRTDIYDVNSEMEKRFGRRFVNLQSYLCSLQSLKDVGIDPTTPDTIESLSPNTVKSDTECIANNRLPSSFWRWSATTNHNSIDTVHPNKDGYKAIAIAIYRRLKLLNYI